MRKTNFQSHKISQRSREVFPVLASFYESKSQRKRELLDFLSEGVALIVNGRFAFRNKVWKDVCRNQKCLKARDLINGFFDEIRQKDKVENGGVEFYRDLKSDEAISTHGLFYVQKYLVDSIVDEVFMVLMIDVSDCYQYVREQNQKMNSLEDIVVSIDPGFRIREINKKGMELFGYDYQKVLGQKCHEALFGLGAQCDDCGIEKARVSGKTENVRKYIERLGGWFSINVTPVKDENGEVVEYFEYGHSINHLENAGPCLKDVQEEYLRANDELHERNKKYSELNDELHRNHTLSEAILEATDNGILVTGYEDDLLKFNRRFLELWDTSQEVFEEMNEEERISFFVCQLKAPDAFLEGVKYLKKNPAETRTDLLYFKDGRIYERFSKTIYWQNEPLGRVWSFRDITRSKLAKIRLKESELRYVEMFENMSSGVAVYKPIGNGADFRFVAFNKTAEKITGINRDNIIGKRFQSVFPKMAGGALLLALKRVSRTGKPVQLNPYFFKFKSHQGWRKNYIYSLPTGEVVSIFDDVTKAIEGENNLKKQNERYQHLNEKLNLLNKELLNAKKIAQESDRLKTAFLANMSHEIRTPMNGILGFSEMLASKKHTPEKVEFYSKVIVDSGHQLLHILDDVLDISKIEAGAIKLRVTNVVVNDLLNDLFTFYNPVTTDKDVSLHVSKPLNDEDSSIEADPKRLRQVLTNLLSNALKFTLSGQVNFGYEMDGGFMRFFVNDTGIGIDKENLQKIFERFWQEESGFSRSYGGTGLGLSISQKLVEIMGGRLEVESAKGKGTVFSFSLPVAQKSIDQEVLKPAVPVNTSANPGPDLTILVAEDEEINFLYMEAVLAEDNVRILHAMNGEKAVELFESNQVDLVLMDIKMPVMDGYEALAKIKELNASVPVIAVTAYALAEEREKGLKMGFDDYLAKPLKSEVIHGMIKKIRGLRV